MLLHSLGDAEGAAAQQMQAGEKGARPFTVKRCGRAVLFEKGACPDWLWHSPGCCRGQTSHHRPTKLEASAGLPLAASKQPSGQSCTGVEPGHWKLPLKAAPPCRQHHHHGQGTCGSAGGALGPESPLRGGLLAVPGSQGPFQQVWPLYHQHAVRQRPTPLTSALLRSCTSCIELLDRGRVYCSSILAETWNPGLCRKPLKSVQ